MALPTSITEGDQVAEPSQDMTVTSPVVGEEIPSGDVIQDTVYSAATDRVENLFDNTSDTTASLNGNTRIGLLWICDSSLCGYGHIDFHFLIRKRRRSALNCLVQNRWEDLDLFGEA